MTFAGWQGVKCEVSLYPQLGACSWPSLRWAGSADFNLPGKRKPADTSTSPLKRNPSASVLSSHIPLLYRRSIAWLEKWRLGYDFLISMEGYLPRPLCCFTSDAGSRLTTASVAEWYRCQNKDYNGPSLWTWVASRRWCVLGKGSGFVTGNWKETNVDLAATLVLKKQGVRWAFNASVSSPFLQAEKNGLDFSQLTIQLVPTLPLIHNQAKTRHVQNFSLLSTSAGISFTEWLKLLIPETNRCSIYIEQTVSRLTFDWICVGEEMKRLYCTLQSRSRASSRTPSVSECMVLFSWDCSRLQGFILLFHIKPMRIGSAYIWLGVTQPLCLRDHVTCHSDDDVLG